MVETFIDNPEAERYRRMWMRNDYRNVAPGQECVQDFIKQAKPKRMDTVIDFGCGTGRAALDLALPPPAGASMDVTMLDFAENCLDADIVPMLVTQKDVLRFFVADLEKPIPHSAQFGLCTDCLEHIPEDKVSVVLRNILNAAPNVFFQISTVADIFGEISGEGPLHLTVRPFSWWLGKLREAGATILWSKHTDIESRFYCSMWAAMPILVKAGGINTTNEELRNNILTNGKRDVPMLLPHERQEIPIMLLAGGPSMAEFEDEIRRKRDAGQRLITFNGTYNWCLERGIMPSAQIIVDARPFNIRFLQPVIPTCRYLLASQVHPSLFDAAPKKQTVLFHAAMNDPICDEIDKLYSAEEGKVWYPVPGGSTALLRGLSLLRILGFYKFEIYGFDSCLGEDDKHHSYAQSENDKDTIVPVRAPDGKVFRCHPWMASQAQEFLDQMRFMGVDIEMIVYGNGLISHLLKIGAEDIEEMPSDEFNLL